MLTLRPSTAGIAYNATSSIPWSETNLGRADFRFRDREDHYWTAEMTAYDAKTATLYLRVVDYETDPGSFKPDLSPKQPVRHLVFAPLDGEAFKSQLIYYQQGKLDPYLAPSGLAPSVPNSPSGGLTPQAEAGGAPAAAPEIITQRVVHFTVSILDLTFGNGGVKGETELPGIAEPVVFSIPNEHILAEFDAIKPFFVRALKRKTARVRALLHFVNDEPRLTGANSPQVAAINEDLLEIFRARSVRQLLSSERAREADKSLFTPDDVFASLDDDHLGKATLPQDGFDLLAEILRHRNVRNARQLEFLAGRLHHEDQKLRFVLSPKFGFVFLARGQDGHHFILELLDSHATYVWSIPHDWKTLDEQYRAVEREIMAIGRIGRGQYRRTLHFEHEFWFVVHENAESKLVDGFPRWKNRLLEGII